MARVDEIIGYGLNADRPVAGSAGRLYYETDTDTILRDNGSTWDELTLGSGGGGGLYSAYLCYQDQEAQNTNGGTFTSGAWRTRVLNTEVADTGGDGSLASNQITLTPGTYYVRASAPGYGCDRHQLRLQNITDATTLVIGPVNYSQTDIGVEVNAVLEGRFTISETTVIELQHQCAVTAITYGLGAACNFTTEIYATVELWKE